MSKKGLILIMEEGSGRILAARVSSCRRVEYEFEKLMDYFHLGSAEEVLPLVSVDKTFVIRLKRMKRAPRIQTDQDVTLPLFSSSHLLP